MDGAVEGITLVRVGAGAVALTHRPKLKALAAIRAAGVTHLVTLLSEREGALAVGSAARGAGLEWIWVGLPNGSQPVPPARAEAEAALAVLAGLVDNGARVVVHCSAGIHRTGMFGYALLRTCGLDAGTAATTLTQLRAVTAEGVGPLRLAWAEELAAAALRRLADAGPPAIRP
jgi:protein-tyrosine phosphatase